MRTASFAIHCSKKSTVYVASFTKIDILNEIYHQPVIWRGSLYELVITYYSTKNCDNFIRRKKILSSKKFCLKIYPE